MSQAERISRIHFLLQLNGQVTVAELKSEFEVSRSTVMRDIEFMRDRLFAPIQYDASANAYIYSDWSSTAGPRDETTFRIPGMWIGANEAYAMLTVINVMSKIDPGLLMPFVRPLRRVLKNILGERCFPMKGFHKKVGIDLPNLRSGNTAVVERLFAALVDEVQATLKWQDPKDEIRCETASIQRLVLGVNGWVVEFLIDQTQERLGVPLARFSACELTSLPTTILPEFKSDPAADRMALYDLYEGGKANLGDQEPGRSILDL